MGTNHTGGIKGMKQRSRVGYSMVLFIAFFFAFTTFLETYAEARAGRGGSMGSRGSRTFTAPQSTPAQPAQRNPGVAGQAQDTARATGQPAAGGGFSRSPLLQGLAGGLAGGMIGSMLFGGMGHAGEVADGESRGGMGLLDMILIGLLLFLGWRFFKKRREQKALALGGANGHSPAQFSSAPGVQNAPAEDAPQSPPPQSAPFQEDQDVSKGLEEIRSMDSNFDEDSFKETAQDLFFRIQAGWMNRSLEGIEDMLTDEMAEAFGAEFEKMNGAGRINRLENIAVRKVELTEAWQEMGKDYITILFTANLLDYTIDEFTGEILAGDKLNPVKFQEFWTFTREIGSDRWQLAGINQTDEGSPTVN